MTGEEFDLADILVGVDTRAIVTYLREQGSSLARLTIGEEYDAARTEIRHIKS